MTKIVSMNVNICLQLVVLLILPILLRFAFFFLLAELVYIVWFQSFTYYCAAQFFSCLFSLTKLDDPPLLAYFTQQKARIFIFSDKRYWHEIFQTFEKTFLNLEFVESILKFCGWKLKCMKLLISNNLWFTLCEHFLATYIGRYLQWKFS